MCEEREREFVRSVRFGLCVFGLSVCFGFTFYEQNMERDEQKRIRINSPGSSSDHGDESAHNSDATDNSGVAALNCSSISSSRRRHSS